MTRFFDGKIDEVRLYNRILSQPEIAEDRGSGYPLKGVVMSHSFQSITGTTATDTHFIVKGQDGGSLYLDGITEYVTVNSGSSFGSFPELTLSAKPNFNTVPVGRTCFVCWATDGGTADNSNGIIFYKKDAPGEWAMQFSNAGTGDTTVIPTAYNPAVNTWYHYLGRLDSAGNVKLYLDSTERATDSGVTNPITAGTNDRIRIGSRTNTVTDLFNGYIDEVRILNKAVP